MVSSQSGSRTTTQCSSKRDPSSIPKYTTLPNASRNARLRSRKPVNHSRSAREFERERMASKSWSQAIPHCPHAACGVAKRGDITPLISSTIYRRCGSSIASRSESSTSPSTPLTVVRRPSCSPDTTHRLAESCGFIDRSEPGTSLSTVQVAFGCGHLHLPRAHSMSLSSQRQVHHRGGPELLQHPFSTGQ